MEEKEIMNLRYLRIMKPFDKMIINEYTSILLLFNEYVCIISCVRVYYLMSMCVLCKCELFDCIPFNVYVCTI